jgi:NADPH:quinone reductase-like Zn-dependent oxidoreductase
MEATMNTQQYPPTPVPATTGTMAAMVQERYGEAEDVLRLATIARPQIGAGDVLVRVQAAGVDRGVWHMVTGLPYPVRLVAGFRTPKARVPGTDVAGRVEAVGANVTTPRVGDHVFGIADGSFAQYARTTPDKLSTKPEHLTFEQAAVMPVSACTALQAVRDHGRVEPGQRVLIIGAAGGVGTFAVQIAKAYGAHVTGVCSTTKLDLVRAIGADHVIDYTRGADITDGRQRYDVIIDIAGNRTLTTLRHALTPHGTLVITGGETGGRWLGGTDRQLRAMILSPFTGQKLGTFIATQNTADLLAIAELMDAGTLTPVIDRTYPLNEVPKAIRYLQDGHARGKVVITI